MTPEEYFHTIYTYHANKNIKMPTKELFELMQSFSDQQNKELLQSTQSMDEELAELEEKFFKLQKEKEELEKSRKDLLIKAMLADKKLIQLGEKPIFGKLITPI